MLLAGGCSRQVELVYTPREELKELPQKHQQQISDALTTYFGSPRFPKFMFGTRRVGPDLSREGGRRSNDWHAVHFFQPPLVSASSPMPNYPWFFDGAPDKPNRRGLALITYVQWLGSWLESYPYYEELNEVRGED